jgi:hypothetical protein
MAERDGLVAQIGDGWELQAAGVRRARAGAGDLQADVVLVNGAVTHAATVALLDGASRDTFAQGAAMSASHAPAPAAIAAALLALVPDALALLQDAGEPRRSQADELVALVRDAGVELFHTPEGIPYADVPAGGHRETWPLGSVAFRDWARRLYFAAHTKTPGGQAVQDALGTLAGLARFDGAERPVYVRVAAHDGALYLDLADADWRVVEIRPDGWEIVASAPVRFRRTRGMLPLPDPEPGGRLDDLRAFLNVTDEGWRLVRAWLVQAMRERGPYPVLVLIGEQGSAKSTAARVLRTLVDPAVAPLRRPPRDPRDLMIAASNAWLTVYDNLSDVKQWLSDTLCVLATGGGMSTRELYSNDEETLFDLTRPVILTAIEDVVTSGDLVDRSALVTLPPIPDEQRRPEADFWRDFDEVRPRILGALLDHVARALRDVDRVQLERLPRMADFALWAYAGLGAKHGAAFLDAYARNRAGAHDIALDSSRLGGELRAFVLERQAWEGTAGELLEALAARLPEYERRPDGWPKTARGMSSQLRRLAPHLRGAGIAVTMPDDTSRQGRERRRVIRIEQRRNQPAAPAAPSAGGANPRPDAETRWQDADDKAAQPSANRPRPAGQESASTSQNATGADGADGADGWLQRCSNQGSHARDTPPTDVPSQAFCRRCGRLLPLPADRVRGTCRSCAEGRAA